MRLTPLDVRKQEFRKGMRGLDADEVYAFLATVADEYEAVLNDNKALRERLLELDDKVQEYRNMEKTLRDTLLTAERVTVEAKDSARREAELIIKEAQLDAEKGARDVKESAMRLRHEIQNLKQQRDSYLSRMKAVVESHLKYLEAAEDDFDGEEKRLDDDIKKWANEAEVTREPRVFERRPEKAAAKRADKPAEKPSAAPPVVPPKPGSASIEAPKPDFSSGAKPEPAPNVFRDAIDMGGPAATSVLEPPTAKTDVETMADPEEIDVAEAPVAPRDAAPAMPAATETQQETATSTAVAIEEAPDSKPSLKELLDRVIDDHTPQQTPTPTPPAAAAEKPPANGNSPQETDSGDSKWSLSRLKNDILARARGDEEDPSDD